MNKFKHVTPTNIAPLGKRQNRLNVLGITIFIDLNDHLLTLIFKFSVKKEDMNSEDTKPIIIEHHQLNSATLGTVVQTINTQPLMTQPQQNQHHHQNMNMQQNHQQLLSWTCELCGRMFSSREEWTMHAKSHLEVKQFTWKSI